MFSRSLYCRAYASARCAGGTGFFKRYGHNTMPKALGLLLPAVLTAGGAIAFYFDGEGGRRKSMFISLIGVAVFIITFAFNL